MAKLDYRTKCLAQKINACNACGDGEELVVHHRNGDRDDNRLDNLVPLCQSCHSRLHATESLTGYLKELQDELPKSALSFGEASAETTTIRISNELADALFDRKRRGESYEDVLWRVAEMADDAVTKGEVQDSVAEVRETTGGEGADDALGHFEQSLELDEQ